MAVSDFEGDADFLSGADLFAPSLFFPQAENINANERPINNLVEFIFELYYNKHLKINSKNIPLQYINFDLINYLTIKIFFSFLHKHLY